MTKLLLIAPPAPAPSMASTPSAPFVHDENKLPNAPQHTPIDGVTYHRLLVPYGFLGRTMPGNYEVHSLHGLADNMTDKKTGKAFDIWGYVSQFAAVICSRMLHTNTQTQAGLIAKIKKTGAKLIVDVDDYWMLNAGHLLYNHYVQHNIPGAVTQLLRGAHLVTTTQPYLRDKIMPYNKNIAILPNCIDGTLEQFDTQPCNCGQPTDKSYEDLVRIGWISGVHHLDDMRLIAGAVQQLLSNAALDGRVQFVLGGFNYDHRQPGRHQIFAKMERCLTNNYALIKDVAYRKYLMAYSPKPYPGEETMPYRRLWARDINHYAAMYNHIDIALAPLCDNVFNRCKSPLKITEAGWFGKPVIASDIFPYRLDHHPAIVRVNPKDRDGFYNAIMHHLNFKDNIAEKGQSLQKYIRNKYDIRTNIHNRIDNIKQTIN